MNSIEYIKNNGVFELPISNAYLECYFIQHSTCTAKSMNINKAEHRTNIKVSLV